MPSGILVTPTTALGARIRDVRELCDWNQHELARRVGVLPSRISEYETGRREPTLPLLARIAGAYQCTVSELLEGVM